MRSGMSGVPAVASRTTKPASSASDSAPKPSVWADTQPWSAALTIV